MAASFANGGSADDILPGIQFFADLKKSGNLGGTDVTKETVLSGETPIALDWSYNVPGLKADLEAAGLTTEVNFPSDGIYGGFYGQGVVKDSPHKPAPSCGSSTSSATKAPSATSRVAPSRPAIDALVKAGTVTDDMKGNLPPDELLSQVAFLTPGPDRSGQDGPGRSVGPDGRRRLIAFG